MQFRTITIIVLASAPCVQCMQLSFDQASISDPYEGGETASSPGIGATSGTTVTTSATTQPTEGNPSDSSTHGGSSGTTQDATSSSTGPADTTTQMPDGSSSTSGETNTSGGSTGLPCTNTGCGDGCVGGDELCEPTLDPACGKECDALCGNGIEEAGEACDDGGDFGALEGVDDGCYKCKVSRLAFVTSQTVSGLFLNDGLQTGIAAANTLCQAAADSRDRAGTYRAWLSHRHCFNNNCDDDHPAKKNVNLDNYAGVFILANGDELASSSTDLAQGILKRPLNIDESNAPQSGFAWTNTKYNGATYDHRHDCDEWFNVVSWGLVGDISKPDMRWSRNNDGSNSESNDNDDDDKINGSDHDLRLCGELNHLYCFQIAS